MAQQQLQQHTAHNKNSNDAGITYDDAFNSSSISNSSDLLFFDQQNFSNISEYYNNHVYGCPQSINFSDDEEDSYEFDTGLNLHNFLDNIDDSNASGADAPNKVVEKNNPNRVKVKSSHRSAKSSSAYVLNSGYSWILFNNNSDEDKGDADTPRNENFQNITREGNNAWLGSPRYEDVISSTGYSLDELSSTDLSKIRKEILHSEEEKDELYTSDIDDDDSSMIEILKKEIRLLFPKQYLTIKDEDHQNNKFSMIDQWQDNSSWASGGLRNHQYSATNSTYLDFINAGTKNYKGSNDHNISLNRNSSPQYRYDDFNHDKTYRYDTVTNKRMFYGYSKIINLTQDEKRRLKQVMQRIKPCSSITISPDKNKLTSYVY